MAMRAFSRCTNVLLSSNERLSLREEAGKNGALDADARVENLGDRELPRPNLMLSNHLTSDTNVLANVNSFRLYRSRFLHIHIHLVACFGSTADVLHLVVPPPSSQAL